MLFVTTHREFALDERALPSRNCLCAPGANGLLDYVFNVVMCQHAHLDRHAGRQRT